MTPPLSLPIPKLEPIPRKLSKRQRRMLGRAKGMIAERAFRQTLVREFGPEDRRFHELIERSRAHDEAALAAFEREPEQAEVK